MIWLNGIRFDGEIVYLEQELDGEIANSIYLYEDEFEEAYRFIKSQGGQAHERHS